MPTIMEKLGRLLSVLLAKKIKIMYGLFVFFLMALETVLVLHFYKLGTLKIDREMFYWLFASTSQSMAALFAVVGMFAVFRYQVLENRFNDMCGSMKRKFATHEWTYYFGITNSEGWPNALVDYHMEDRLKRAPANLPGTIRQDLEVSLVILRSIKEAMEFVLKKAKIPLIAVLVTFLMAIGCTPFSSTLSARPAGLIILIIIMGTISISMFSILWFLIKAMGR